MSTSRRIGIFAALLFLAASATGIAQTRVTISDGVILVNGRPFPLVLDAGANWLSPPDDDTARALKDAWGANTNWLQYSMRHMRSEDEGDFSPLLEALDTSQKAGMWVNLYVRAEPRDLPSWFSQKYDDYQMLDPKGKPVAGQVCLQHEAYRRLIDRYLRLLARAARKKPALLMYTSYDEFCIRGWGCFCPRCIRKYRDYLKNEYGEIGKLNRSWSSAYGSWDQIDAPRTQSFDANYGDWQQYRLKVLHDFGMLYYKALKEEDPDHVVWLDISMDLFGYTWQRLCLWWKTTDLYDILNLGPEWLAEDAAVRTAMARAIRDNYGKGATWHRTVPYEKIEKYIDKPEIYALLFESSHSGLVWWYAPKEVLASGKAWGVGDAPDSHIPVAWYAARESNHLAQYLDDLYVYSKPARGEAALFVSGQTDMVRSAAAKQALQGSLPTNLNGLADMLRDLNVPYEAIGEDQIPKLNSFKAVVAGQFAMAADEATARAFREYVRNGGTLIATNGAFSADRNGREVANPSFGLEELWGSAGRVDDQAGDGRVATVDGKLAFPSVGGVARRTIGAAQVMAKLPDGTAAVTWNRYGKGQVFFVGTNAGEAYNAGHLLAMGRYWSRGDSKLDPGEYRKLVQRYDGWRNWALLLQDMLARAGVRSPVRARTPEQADLLGTARVSLQDEKVPGRRSANHLLVVTLEPVWNPLAQVQLSPPKMVRAKPRTLKNLTIQAKIPHPEQVLAVYRIPPIGDELGKINAVPEKLPFRAIDGELRVVVPEVAEAACLLVARDARPLVGIEADRTGFGEGKPMRVRVTVDNAAARDVSGELLFPPGFRVEPAGGTGARFAGLKPGTRYAAQFDVTPASPGDGKRTFRLTARYLRNDGQTGETSSYPLASDPRKGTSGAPAAALR